jgi:predicted nucleic acid-binding Zn ribbon protein
LKGTGWYVTDYGRKNGSQTGDRGSSRKDEKKEDKPAVSK